MSSLSDSLQRGFAKYYNTITKVGYIDRQAVNNLIIASWINDVLEGKYGVLVDDEQYSILNSLYQCIEGMCLVPYQNYCTDVTVNKTDPSQYIRITEDDLYRLLEQSNDLRVL